MFALFLKPGEQFKHPEHVDFHVSVRYILLSPISGKSEERRWIHGWWVKLAPFRWKQDSKWKCYKFKQFCKQCLEISIPKTISVRALQREIIYMIYVHLTWLVFCLCSGYVSIPLLFKRFCLTPPLATFILSVWQISLLYLFSSCFDIWYLAHCLTIFFDFCSRLLIFCWDMPLDLEK